MDNEMKEYVFMIDVDFKPEIPNKFAEEFVEKLSFVSDILKIHIDDVEVFETKRGLHIYVYASSFRNISDEEIVVIQLALGSDYKREIFNWTRVISNPRPRRWNVMFKDNERVTMLSSILTKLINSKLNKLEV